MNDRIKFTILLITIIIFASCSDKQKQTGDSSVLFSENEIKYFKGMLNEYKNVDSLRFNEFKQYSIEYTKMNDENKDIAKLEKHLDDNLVRVDSIVDACFVLLDNKQYKDMAVLLDANYKSFYIHSSTSVELFYMFTSILDILYIQLYTEDEATAKMIKMHEFSCLYYQSVHDMNSNKDALHYYYEDLSILIMLYRLSENYQKQIEFLEAMSEVADSETYEEIQEELAKARENLKMQNSASS